MQNSTTSLPLLQSLLLQWYDAEKRDLPWRHTDDPYAIWVSEIMLQQTRAETVVGYWTRFMDRYPTVRALAAAPEQDVLKAWEGLGYYSRARNLLRCAQVVCAEHGGVFPADVAALRKLPGIGEYTAGAVASIAFGIRTAAVDGNVERVISRLRGIREDIGIPSVRRQLRAEADALVPPDRPGDFNQAMMELGARVCQPAPRCAECPVRQFCDAYEAGDADALPVKQRKAPQRILPRGVALVFHAGRVLLHRREERLLYGLWCFPGFDHAVSPAQVERALQALGITASYAETLGEVRHIFTHIIWDMTILRFDAATDACPEGWRWADAGALDVLPLPTAMRVARGKARERLLSF
ncbi:A/G-specific adenine glycosylase [Eubacteriales bacterium OttesenSCG-928-A19]|nr:A/G-specific adenine glycosylase [Eubacteriales bacterium OttesenSCG-928-A19]